MKALLRSRCSRTTLSFEGQQSESWLAEFISMGLRQSKRESSVDESAENEVVETFLNGEQMVILKHSAVPRYLQAGAFFAAMNCEEYDDTIEVPRKCFKLDETVATTDDFAQMIRIIEFWGLEEIPESVLDYCANNHIDEWEVAMKEATDNVHLFTLFTGYFVDQASISRAVESTHPELVRHWIKRNPPSSPTGGTAIADLASTGQLYRITEFHENHKYPLTPEACWAAVRFGHLDCLKYLRSKGCLWNSSLICYAATHNGHLDCLKFLHENGCTFIQDCAYTVHIECLQYVLENGYPFPINEDTCFGAISNAAPLECMVLLGKHGAVWDERCTAECVQLDLYYLQHAMESGFPAFDDLVSGVGSMNKLDHLHYLIDHMLLEMDARTLSVCIATGCVECVEYLVDTGCPFDFELYHLISKRTPSIYTNDVSILECMMYTLQHGWQANAAFVRFVDMNQLPLCQEYLRSNDHFISSQ